MITKDLYKYSKDNWKEFESSITELSMIDQDKSSLVISKKRLYNFDSISQSINEKSKLPTSVDSIIATQKDIILVEFKTGFVKRITKENLDPEQAKCPEIEGKAYVCDQYWKLFFKKQKQDTDRLIDSIKLKAIESYITLEKKIIPKCENFQNGNKKLSIKLFVVIDGNGEENMEDTLADLAGKFAKPVSKNNYFNEIRKSLIRLIQLKDSDNREYYYTEINVMSSCDFLNKVNLGTISTISTL